MSLLVPPVITSSLVLNFRSSAVGLIYDQYLLVRGPPHMAFVAPLSLFRGRQRKSLCARVPKCRRSPTALLRKFDAADFEIHRIVGQQGYATQQNGSTTRIRDPTAPTRITESSEPEVRLCNIFISAPFLRLYRAGVLLKESREGGVHLGVNEAEAYKILHEADGIGIDDDGVPVAALMGTFLTDNSFAEASFALRRHK